MNAGGPRRASAPATLAEARKLFGAGRFGEAEAILRDFIAANVEMPEALELLGACLGALGRHGEALERIDRALALRAVPAPAALYNRAQALLALGRAGEARSALEQVVSLKPDFAQAWTALGRALAALGDAGGAERAYRHASRLNPGSADAFYNLARFLHDAGRIDEAIAGYRKALAVNPQLAAAHNNLGNALRVKGVVGEAFEHYAQAVRLAPALVEALTNFGTALREAGRAPEAIPLLERAVQLQPQSASALTNLGVAHYAVNRFADAEACERRALELDPLLDEARINLGNALWAQARFDEAVACYRAVIARSPQNADAHSNLGIALHDLDQVDAAIEAYREALRLRPDHPDALNNLGFLFEQEGRRDEAKALYRKALEANPRFARAAYNLALAMLADFEFREGWRLSDASRFDIVPPVAIPRAFAIPRFQEGDWDRVRKLAVWKEQGVGDQILYATPLGDLEARGIAFVLEADARLVPAFKRAHPAWEVVPAAASEGAFRGCDRHIPAGSLAGLLRPTRESFERQPARLLAADPGRARELRARLHAPGSRLVGISWRSFQPSVRAYVERRKSAPLAAFRELSLRDDIRLIDLQYGDTAGEREAFARSGGRLQRAEGLDLFHDLDGVLAAIEACDLVVTTSNVTAHLAASIGKETWLLYLSGIPAFFYWAPDESGRCLWYPSVRIIAGSARRTWADLMARVHELLDARSA